jgi:hypothetical protein
MWSLQEDRSGVRLSMSSVPPKRLALYWENQIGKLRCR